jgi:hypothetical protein
MSHVEDVVKVDMEIYRVDVILIYKVMMMMIHILVGEAYIRKPRIKNIFGHFLVLLIYSSNSGNFLYNISPISFSIVGYDISFFISK